MYVCMYVCVVSFLWIPMDFRSGPRGWSNQSLAFLPMTRWRLPGAQVPAGLLVLMLWNQEPMHFVQPFWPA